MIEYLLNLFQKHSHGYIRDRKDAENVLMVLSVFVIVICVTVMFIRSSQPKKYDDSGVKEAVRKYESMKKR